MRWQGEPGQMMRVSCYTNLPEAELFLNGTSLGRKTTEPAGGRIVWEVAYQPGTLSVRSAGLEHRLSTPSPAERIELSCVPDPYPDKDLQVIQVEVFLRDRDGNPALDEPVRCQVIGDLELLGMENGIPDDLTAYSASCRSTLDGRLIVFLRKTGSSDGENLLYLRTGSGLREKAVF